MTQNVKQRILWVDDVFRNVLHDLMAYVDELEGSKGGFEVVTKTNPDDALTMLEKQTEKFACIILDIMLPFGEKITRGEAQAGNTTGVILENMIREIDMYKNVPIVMLTGVRRHEKIVIEYLKRKSKDCFFKADISAEKFREHIQTRIQEASND